MDTLRPGPAAHNGTIAPLDSVSAKLLAEMALGRKSPGKDDKAARVLVESVDCSHFAAAKQCGQLVRERRWQVASAAGSEFRSLVVVPHRRQAGRLVHDHEVGVGKTDDRLIGSEFGH
jgi:hypothetical protein